MDVVGLFETVDSLPPIVYDRVTKYLSGLSIVTYIRLSVTGMVEETTFFFITGCVITTTSDTTNNETLAVDQAQLLM